MNKKKKDDLYESKWEVFLRNYNQVPAFKAIVRLGVYFLFFLAFILIVNLGAKNLSSEENPTTTTITNKEEEKMTYKDILNKLANENISISFTSLINNYETRITASVENSVISGLMENQDLTKKFKIKDNQIYEIVLDSENLNPNLFVNINYDFLVPSKLVEILNSNQATKRIDGSKVIYNYNITYNGVNYDTIVIVENNSVKSIELKQENNQYMILYS